MQVPEELINYATSIAKGFGLYADDSYDDAQIKQIKEKIKQLEEELNERMEVKKRRDERKEQMKNFLKSIGRELE